ncbi:MAG: hypothetical protein ACXVAY_10255 [Mucilaginibacter sp.]
MKNEIFSNWTLSRVLRLGIALLIVYQAFRNNDVLFGIVGLLFAGMAVLNRGCCSSVGCYVPAQKTTDLGENISYEEVK